MKWINIAKISEIEPGQSLVVKFDGEDIAIFNAGEAFYAVNNACPHQGDRSTKVY